MSKGRLIRENCVLTYALTYAQLVENAEDGLIRSIIARETHVLRPHCPSMNIRKYF